MTARLMILNGPNLNLLGVREPHIYGSTTLAAIKASCEELAKSTGARLSFHQSNHEGALVDKLHEVIDSAAGALINPAGLTQHGVSLHDAIKGAGNLPLVEIHISNVHQREAFRHHSYISPAAAGIVVGFGTDGYRIALLGLARKAGL